MVRLVACTIVIIILSSLVWSTSGFGQEMPPSDMCDLYIDETRATWPPLHITVNECMKMLREALPNLKDGVDIQCKCVRGTSAS